MHLHYKPRLRGKKSVRWWTPTPDTKNRGFVDSKDRPRYIYNLVAVPFNDYVVLATKTSELWRGAIIPEAGYTSVVYGFGRFVAVSHGQLAAYSGDGEMWIGTFMPTSRNWKSVTYGIGKFIAVAVNTNDVAYSEDGESWSLSSLPSVRDWISVEYGASKFVTIARDSDKIAYSSNGTSWTEVTIPISDSWKKIVYGGTKFVAIAENSDKTVYSENATTWLQGTLPATTSWQSIAVSSNKWVAVSYGTIGAYSTDGVSWTQTTLPDNADWSDVTFFGDRFIAIAKGQSFVATSTNGTTWTKQTLPSMSPRDWVAITGTDEINQRVCVSVIDETSSTSQAAYNNNYNTFRSLWPNRPLYIMRVGTSTPFYIPANWGSNPNDHGPITVNRDNGNTTLTSDWFAIANLDNLITGSKVGLFIDTSGSMTLSSVQASYNLFQSQVAAAGLQITNVFNSNEDYITPFINMLE